MCVIVHQPSDAYLSRRTAEQMWERNPDGGGYAFINSVGEIEIGKAMDFERFWKKFEVARSANRDKDFLVHFRIATSGIVSLQNTHPFFVDGETVMAHNGILTSITGPIPANAERSDTRVFIDTVLPQLPETWLDNPVLVDMVEDYIGGSKLMFLTTNPKLQQQVYILNERMGTEKHGMWWSNKAHEPQPKFNQSQRQTTYVSSASKITPSVQKKEDKKDDAAAVYKLPLPRDDERVRGAHERSRPTQEEVEAFWLGSSFPGLSYQMLSEDTNDPDLDLLISVRKEMGLEGELLLDPVTDMYECQICYSNVNPASGDCKCWDSICIGCGNMAPYCIHVPDEMELYPVQEAYKAYQVKQATLTKGGA